MLNNQILEIWSSMCLFLISLNFKLLFLVADSEKLNNRRALLVLGIPSPDMRCGHIFAPFSSHRTAGDEALDLKAPSDPSPPSPPSPRQSDQSPPDAVQVGSWISWTTGSRCFKNLQDCKSCLVLWEVLFFFFSTTAVDCGRQWERYLRRDLQWLEWRLNGNRRS